MHIKADKVIAGSLSVMSDIAAEKVDIFKANKDSKNRFIVKHHRINDQTLLKELVQRAFNIKEFSDYLNIELTDREYNLIKEKLDEH